jgi:hypothetical protein
MPSPANALADVDDQPDNEAADGLQIREVAALLGISRSRVIQIEQAAMAKLKARLSVAGVDSPDDFTDAISLPKPCGSDRSASRANDNEAWRESLFAGPGWLKADQVVCINDNTAADPADVALSFAFLSGQRRNEKLVKIPVIAAGSSQVRVVGHINGVNSVNKTLRIHVCASPSASLDNIDLSACRVTAITETHSGEDGHGSFCVPVLISVIVSLPGAVPKPMRDYIRLAKDC